MKLRNIIVMSLLTSYIIRKPGDEMPRSKPLRITNLLSALIWPALVVGSILFLTTTGCDKMLSRTLDVKPPEADSNRVV
jgi:hypothetical protein